MKFILFTRPDFFAGEEDIINTLFENGLELLHLRKPNSAPVYMERLLSLI
ncbi:MAG TPA: thiamine phosphate synthase, partial [Candidatus Avibacteroides excrementipullorum]|nr:thiamine phosphate synthase [Candidatus Avibacteroides excrementipullorum]